MKYKLGDICELITGFPFRSKDFSDICSTPVIKIADISPLGIYSHNLPHVDETKYDQERLQKYLVKKGDFVFAMTGAIGRIGMVLSGEMYINQRVLTFKNIKDDCLKKFLYYVLCSNDFQNYALSHIDSATAQPNIGINTLSRYEIDLPDLATQKKIVRILSALDSKIELNNSICTNLENQASTIFKNWFIDLEPFQTENFVATELGTIPDSWTIKSLGDLFDFKRGVTLTKNDVSSMQNNEYPFVVYGAGRDIFGYSKEYVLDTPSVLIAAIGAGAGTVSRSYETKYSVTSNAFYVLPKDKIDYIYEVFALRDYNFKDKCSGSAQPMLSYSAFATDKCLFPPRDVRRNFYNICAPILEQINELMKQNNILENIRDALLPKLMNNEINLKKDLI